MTGFRATVVVHDPGDCPVADVSAIADEPIESVTWTRASDGSTVEEFDAPADASIESDAVDADLTAVQSNDVSAVYRFEREGDGCVCEIVEGTGTPISSVRARDGSLLLSFHTLDLEEIAVVVDGLREHFDGVIVEDLAQDRDGDSADPVVVDRDALTPRQREIVETAHELGYFEYPKGANATEVADELGVARSTFSEHLAAAQTKLMAAILDN
ncbi:helix-turn-helix domain-containing protein [Natrarchaeobius oligotrophus]|uniref:Bacterio-opsin activator n=1 Tax=Natrarchaeobius chitinivorans TaxID=1679083 RepID=A0A3N6PKY0_NATCH|nr:helix-turn-helix domain-containing protein [Natrarchaeobius chitinivorans]RQH02000.1 bacterio-opsin activator [Natrarchaeobius chitinivorans]